MTKTVIVPKKPCIQAVSAVNNLTRRAELCNIIWNVIESKEAVTSIFAGEFLSRREPGKTPQNDELEEHI